MHVDRWEKTPEEWSAQLGDADPAHRMDAAAALGRFGRRARPAVPRLMEALRDPHAGVRKMAALALGDLGVDGAAATPMLIETLGDDDDGVRRRVSVALCEIAL